MIPADHCHLVGGGRAGGETAFESRGRKKIQFGVHFAYSGGNFDVDGEAIEQVAAPFQSFATGEKFEAGEIDDGSVRGVLARNPLRVVESQVAGRWRESLV